MTRPTFDLQSHSIHSDGALPPSEVVARAAAAGVELLALTDHDTVDGVAEAAAAARAHGIRALARRRALEPCTASTRTCTSSATSSTSPTPTCSPRCEDFRADRGRRIQAMADRLRELGFALDDARARARRDAGKPIGRPHLADAVLAHPANARAARATRGSTARNALFPPYLVPGAAGLRRALAARPSPQAIEVIHAAGGVAVWAHPFWDLDDPDEALRTLERFAAAGLDGVECFYPTHRRSRPRRCTARRAGC